jgi:hypothetical protein
MRAAQAQAYGPPAQKISTDTGNEQLAEGCQYAAGHAIIAGAMGWALLAYHQEMNAGHSIWHIQVLLQLLSGQCCESVHGDNSTSAGAHLYCLLKSQVVH